MFKINELLKVTKGKLTSGVSNGDINGISIDTRTIKPQDAFIAIKGDNFDGHDFIGEAVRKGAKIIIQSSVVRRPSSEKVTFILVKDTIRALGDIARFWRKKFDIPIIAVTGSNGKTTAKEMIAAVLSKKFKVLKNEGTKNNQIGLPMALLNLNNQDDIAVLEVGTNHFGEVNYLAKICQPNIGIITNIGPAHLEFLRNLKGVFNEKHSLIRGLKKPYIAILNADDSLLKRELTKRDKKPFVIGFGIKNKSDFFASDIKNLSEKLEFSVNPAFSKTKMRLNTLGSHNIYNALTAVAVARLFGVGYKDIAESLANFDFPQSRLKIIKLKNIKFIDDTYNSNPLSLKQALDTLSNFDAKGKKIFVMGDMMELGNRNKAFHYQAGRQAAGVCDKLITVGRLSKLAAEGARACGLDIKDIFTCDSSVAARDILFKKISPGENDIVLIKGSRLMKMEEILKT